MIGSQPTSDNYFCHDPSLRMAGRLEWIVTRSVSLKHTVGMAGMMVRVGKPGRYRTIGRSACAAFILLSMGLLISCNSATVGSSNDGSQLDIMDKVRSLDLLPHQPQPVNAGTTASGQGRSGGRPMTYEGTDV